MDTDYATAYIKRVLNEMQNGHQNKVIVAAKDFKIEGTRKGKNIVLEISPREVYSEVVEQDNTSGS